MFEYTHELGAQKRVKGREKTSLAIDGTFNRNFSTSVLCINLLEEKI